MSTNSASRPRSLTLASLLLAAVVLAACGSDDGDAITTTEPNSSASDIATTSSTAPSTAESSDTTADTTADTAAPSDSPAVDAVDTTEAASDEGSTALSFTDDRGETITFDEPPRRVVAWQAIVPALVELGIEPVGVIAFNDIETNPAFIDAGVDTASLTPVSTSYGEVDLEALAALDPDVIVTYTFGDELLTGFADEATQSLAAEIAPFVVFDGQAPTMAGIEKTEEFAEVLGADLTSEFNTADAADFDSAVAELETLVTEKPGLTATFGGPAPIGLFVAPVDAYPELQFYRDLGMDIFSGTEDMTISWELVEDVAADVFLIDDRTTEAELDEAANVATWASIPAVAAGQYSATWRFLLSYSRADYARTINRMLPTLEAADPDVV